MKIDKIKVRPKKDLAVAPCAAEFAAMLACWASSNDLSNTGTCADRGRALQDCLRTKVRMRFWKSRLCLTYILLLLGQGESTTSVYHQLPSGSIFQANVNYILYN